MTILVPVNPVMVVERSNDCEVLVHPDQQGRQQGGHAHQGGARCQKAAECWKKQVFSGTLQSFILLGFELQQIQKIKKSHLDLAQ